jgi:ABC-2 type transport system ATP-binding protein
MSRTHPKPSSSAARPSHPKPPKPPKKAAGAAKQPAAKAEPPAPKAPAGALLWAQGVTKTYGDLPALAPVTLTVRPHEAVVLIGHNGSGKTTFLRIAAGLLEPSGGVIQLDGHDAGSLGARAAVSYVSDNPTFYEDLSVWEHLEYVARLNGRDDWEQDAADLLGHLGIYERADDLPVTFSRGLRQKTALALGLIRPFELLLIDEPFVGLDAAGKAALLELLEEAHGKGGALMVATHELEFVQRVERCIALRDGELAYDGGTTGIDVLGLVS